MMIIGLKSSFLDSIKKINIKISNFFSKSLYTLKYSIMFAALVIVGNKTKTIPINDETTLYKSKSGDNGEETPVRKCYHN